MSILSDESLTAPVNCATFYPLEERPSLLVRTLREAPQRTANNLRIRRRPHGGQGTQEEAAVTLGQHARIEDRHDAPVIERARETGSAGRGN